MQLNFPLYKIRSNYSIEDRGDFTLVFTKYNVYILDAKNLEGDFATRRTKLLSIKKKLPHKLYPLKERYTMISQLANSKDRWFIDSTGKVFKYKPSKFFNIHTAKVLRVDRSWNGKYRLMTTLPVPFVCDQAAKYVQYIKYGKGYLLYGLSNERIPTTRKKI